MMDIEDIFKLLESEGLEPEYIEKDKYGFSRNIKFKTKYCTFYIEWWKNISYLSVHDRYAYRKPFTGIRICPHSSMNKRCIRVFSNDDFYDTSEIVIQKLDWQECNK